MLREPGGASVGWMTPAVRSKRATFAPGFS
jgi:hypothetical protein